MPSPLRPRSAILVSALVVACAGGDPQPAPTPQGPALQKIRIALNWVPEPEFGGFYEGVLGGHYEKAGFDVELIPGGPGAPTLELLTTGKAEVAITMADDLLVKRQRGVKGIAVWPAFQDSPAGLMVHAASGIKRFADIGTKPKARVAIEIGSPMQTWLWSANGWEGKVEAVPYAGGVASFLADPDFIQQAYITAEPCQARAKGATVEFLQTKDTGWNPYGTVVALPEPIPDWGKAFVAATDAAWQAYVADPGRANARMVELNDQLNADLMRCITDAQAPFLTGADGMGKMTAERWEATADALQKVGLLPAGTTAAGAWTTL